MILDPTKTYLEWNGTSFPNSSNAQFKAPAGSTIDWGDGVVESFATTSTSVNMHTYTDGITKHTITISGLTSIDYKAFQECTDLTSVTIGNSVTSIGEDAFGGCSSLTSIIIPDSVKSIDSYAFLSCSKLTGVYITDIAAWCNISFKHYYANPLYYAHNLYLNNQLVTELVIPDDVTSIGNYAFYSCKSLTSVTIGNSVTSIGDSAFYSCKSLTSVTIPNSVTSIGNYAFIYCNNLKTIVLFPETPPTLSSTNAISTTISAIYVQQSSKDSYKADTNWTSFANKIESNDIYLSLVRFNKKNKEYIDSIASNNKEYIDSIASNNKEYVDSKDLYTYTYSFSTADINMANETITFIAPLIPNIEEATTLDQIRTCISNFLISKKYNNNNNVLLCTGNIGHNVNERGIPYGLYIDGSGNLTALLTKYDFTVGTRIITISDTGAAGSLRYSKLN